MYRTQLQREDTQEFREREREAARIAGEIERSAGYHSRSALENGGDDEEMAFSAVHRGGEGAPSTRGGDAPSSAAHRGGDPSTPPTREGSAAPPAAEGTGNKYVPPHLRTAASSQQGGGPPPRGIPRHTRAVEARQPVGREAGWYG